MADAVVVSGLLGKWGVVNSDVVEEGDKGVD